MRCLAPLLLVLVIFMVAYGWLWVWPKILDYFTIEVILPPVPTNLDLAHDMSRV